MITVKRAIILIVIALSLGASLGVIIMGAIRTGKDEEVDGQ